MHHARFDIFKHRTLQPTHTLFINKYYTHEKRHYRHDNGTTLDKNPCSYSRPFQLGRGSFFTASGHSFKTTNSRHSQKVRHKAKLGQFPNMEVTVYKLEGSDTPTPSILKKRKNVTTETVTSVEQVGDLIHAKTSVRVSENDLLQK